MQRATGLRRSHNENGAVRGEARTSRMPCPPHTLCALIRRSNLRRKLLSGSLRRRRALAEEVHSLARRAVCPRHREDIPIQAFDEAQEEGRDTLRAPKTHPWSGAAPITWPMRRKRFEWLTRPRWGHGPFSLHPRRYRSEPPQTGQDLSCTAANAKSLIRKALEFSSEHHLLRPQHVVFPQNRLVVAVRGSPAPKPQTAPKEKGPRAVAGALLDLGGGRYARRYSSRLSGVSTMRVSNSSAPTTSSAKPAPMSAISGAASAAAASASSRRCSITTLSRS